MSRLLMSCFLLLIYKSFAEVTNPRLYKAKKLPVNVTRNVKLKFTRQFKPCSAAVRQEPTLLDKLKLGVQKTRAGLVSA